MTVAVLGSGGGALAVAADLARAKRQPIICDLPEFAVNLDMIKTQGGVKVVSDWYGPRIESVLVADDVGTAIAGAELVIVVVPCFGHRPWMKELTPLLSSDQALLFLGEGSGAIVARQSFWAADKPDVLVGEANTLPYLARPAGPGAVTAFRKDGGFLISALPATGTSKLVELTSDVWPYLQAAGSIWDTVLINYNAIDHVATMVANAGTLENRSGGMLLWGEGATPAVVRVIEAVDAELFAIRQALGSTEQRRYRDFLVAQGFAPDESPELFATMRSSKLVPAFAPTASAGGLNTRYITEDVPYALVLASDLGDAVAVDTPVIDGLIALTSVMLERDFRDEGRTLASLGLDGLDAAGLEAFAATGAY